MKKLILLPAIALLLLSCNPSDRVKFEEPQPANIKESTGFRTLRQGRYINVKTPKKEVEIKKNMITTRRTFHLKKNRNNIEISKMADVDRQNDSAMISHFSKLGAKVKIMGDTIYLWQTVTDTFFRINEHNILKHYKRSYYLNFEDKDGFWEVYRIKFHGDTLLFGEITPTDTLLTYDYTRVDSVNGHPNVKEYVLHPDKKELRKLMRSNAFKVTEKYIKE
ncbi:MAG: hypothetical protein DSY76_08580 [Bacteroidetes bacterium]|nr:MAG: hypothetical protein DSY76_08580 [Bacteroidota bacterium]